MKPRLLAGWVPGIVALLLAAPAAPAAHAAPAAPLVINLGTLAPADSPWHKVLKQMGQEWSQISNGQVVLHIYPGGVMGDERAMIQKMRVGLLQAVGISGAGLPEIEPGVMALQLPLMFDSYEELDYVRDRLAPRLEKAIEEKGFVVLNWGDAGWVLFFTKTPARRPDDLRRMRLFITAGDAKTEELYKAAGFHPVPLATTDMLASLETGMIDAFDVPPLLAMLNQWFGVAKNMIDLRWAPLVGATLVDRKAWGKIPEAQRAPMLEAGRRAGERFRGEIRKLSEDAVGEMQKRGLNVVRLSDRDTAAWRAEVDAIYPKLRGTIVPAELFDEARRLRDERRSGLAATK